VPFTLVKLASWVASFDMRSIRGFYETSATDRREKYDLQQRTSGAALG
jgi:hypothetical protein